MKTLNSNSLGLSAQPPQTPWFLRFAVAANPKEMAATAGLAAIYGLLFAGLLLAPLLPHLAAQSNSPTNNSPTNSVSTPPPTDHPTGLGDYDNARSKADCREIWNEKKKTEWDKYEDAQKAADTAWALCWKNRDSSRKLNEAVYQQDIISADAAAESNFWGCLGFAAGPATGVTIAGTRTVVRWVKGGAVAVGRAASGIAGAVVGIASFAACRTVTNNQLANAIDAAGEVKRIQNELAENSFNQCLQQSNVKALNDEAHRLKAKYYRHYNHWKRQYDRCVEFFEDQEDENQDGNCATID